jgi:hypothetical protein
VSSPDEELIRRYYAAFNARRFADAAGLVSHDCEFHHLPTRERARGPNGYLALVEEWVAAAPDVTLTPEHIAVLADGVYRVQLRVRGRFDGAFEFRPLQPVDGAGKPFDFLGVHDITIRDGAMVVSRFSYDVADFVGPS